MAIAGRGEEEENLRRLASELGIADRVRLLGLRDDIDRVLAAGDLFVQPSLSEGLPLAVLEAMSAGLPIVATRVGGVGEAVVDGETGLLVEPGDAPGLALAVRRLLDDPIALASFGESARRRARPEFSVDAMAAHYEELYASLR